MKWIRKTKKKEEIERTVYLIDKKLYSVIMLVGCIAIMSTLIAPEWVMSNPIMIIPMTIITIIVYGILLWGGIEPDEAEGNRT